MDTFVESSWYYLRYLSPQEDGAPFSKSSATEWMPVDLYIGGIEHACMHLLYARFFYKALRDLGYIDPSAHEPFARLLTQGMVIKDGAKMSKSKGNVVSPSSIIDLYGADTARLFCLFAAPPEKDLDWNEKGVEGSFRFLSRIVRLYTSSHLGKITARRRHDLNTVLDSVSDSHLLSIRRKTHWMIERATSHIENDKYNTAISGVMELINDIYALLSENASAFDSDPGIAVFEEAIDATLRCLSPFAPHLSEELWEKFQQDQIFEFPSKSRFISEAPWPVANPKLLQSETFLLVVQVNGKVRDKIELSKDATETEVKETVTELPKIQPYLQRGTLQQFIYIPHRLANLVIRES